MHNNIDLSDLIDKPHRFGATGPDAYDCYTLAREVCARAGIDLPERKSIIDIALRAAAIEKGKEQFEKVKTPEPFALVGFFKIIDGQRVVSHMGIVLNDCRRFIHTCAGTAVTIERLEKWRRRIDGFYRYTG